MTDSEIIELYLQRDERAIAATQERFGKYCEKIARNILGSDADAQECVNDVYLKAWESIPPERPNILAAYLAAITRNVALSRYRKETAGKRGGGEVALILGELSELVSDGSSVEKTAEKHELIASINRFLDELPKTSRRAFVLRFVCCESVRDIARRLGKSENSVSVSLNRTKKQLKKHLDKEGFDL